LGQVGHFTKGCTLIFLAFMGYTSANVFDPHGGSEFFMRNFQTLDGTRIDPTAESLEFFLTASDDDEPLLAMRREGIYVTISASYGPLEIAMRPRYEDLARTLNRLTVVDGLHTTRQVGTGQAYLAMGLTAQNDLLMRLTIVADATGHLSLNLKLTPEARIKLYDWLGVVMN
jgi:hypothetical protein